MTGQVPAWNPDEAVDYAAEDEKTLNEIRAALAANKLAPLSEPMGLEAMGKGVFPITLGLLVGLQGIDASAVTKQSPFEATGAALPAVIVVAALLVSIGLGLTAFVRLRRVIAAEDAWRNQNTMIQASAYGWFLRRAAPEMRVLKRYLDAAAERAPRAPMPGPLREGHAVVDRTLQAEAAELMRLLRIVAASADAGRIRASDRERSAISRIAAHSHLLIGFSAGLVERFERQRLDFRISFLTLDLLLLPVAVLLLVLNLDWLVR